MKKLLLTNVAAALLMAQASPGSSRLPKDATHISEGRQVFGFWKLRKCGSVNANGRAVAPMMVWVHWVVYNMPPDTKSLPENAGKARLPQGALLGLNDFKKTGYGGPCPPIGSHRYSISSMRWISRSI
jgi:hypothetical protein